MIKDKNLVKKVEQIEECKQIYHDECKRILTAFGGKRIELEEGYYVCDETLTEALQVLFKNGYPVEVIAKASGLTMAKVIKTLSIDKRDRRSKIDFYGKVIDNKDIDVYIDSYHKDMVVISREHTYTAKGRITEYILEQKREKLIYVVTAEYHINKKEREKESAFFDGFDLEHDVFRCVDKLGNLKVNYYSEGRIIKNGKLKILNFLLLSVEILPFALMLIVDSYNGLQSKLFEEICIQAAKELYQRNQKCHYEKLILIHHILINDSIWTETNEEYVKAVREGKVKGIIVPSVIPGTENFSKEITE